MPKLADIIRKEVKHFDMNPRDINNGMCDIFMTNIIDFFGDLEYFLEEKTVNDYMPSAASHYWIYDPYTGLHHDAETPEGVDHTSKLPFFKRYREIHRKNL